MGLQLKKQEAEKIFKKLGVNEKTDSHHVRGFICVNGIKVLPVFYSHGNGDMPGKIPEKFRKSLLLNHDEFMRLKECPMRKEEYYSLLEKRIIMKKEL